MIKEGPTKCAPMRPSPFPSEQTNSRFTITPNILTRSNIDKVMLIPMSHPWHRNLKPQDLDQVFALSQRNYEVDADVGPEPQRLRRVLEILDTGAGPNFIRQSELPEGVDALIKYGPIPQVCNANGKPLSTLSSEKMPTRLWRFLGMLEFIVCEILAASAIMGKDYCDRFIEDISVVFRLVVLLGKLCWSVVSPVMCSAFFVGACILIVLLNAGCRGARVDSTSYLSGSAGWFCGRFVAAH